VASPAQVRANQKNARRSTGPRTTSGKRTVSLNAVKYGKVLADPQFWIQSHEAAALAAALCRDNDEAEMRELAVEIAQHLSKLRVLRVLEIAILTQVGSRIFPPYISQAEPLRRVRALMEPHLPSWKALSTAPPAPDPNKTATETAAADTTAGEKDQAGEEKGKEPAKKKKKRKRNKKDGPGDGAGDQDAAEAEAEAKASHYRACLAAAGAIEPVIRAIVKLEREPKEYARRVSRELLQIERHKQKASSGLRSAMREFVVRQKLRDLSLEKA
jgi:hypothetical protein